MAPRAVFLAAMTALAGAAMTTGVQAQAEHHGDRAIRLVQGTGMQGHTNAPSGAPMTGSEQSPGRPTGPGPMVTSPPGIVPNSNASGPESSNSMPLGHMAADPNRPAGPASGSGPMVGSSPNTVPMTGSAAGAETQNSMPPGHMSFDANKK